MFKSLRLILAIAVAGSFNSFAIASEVDFLKLSVGARATGMGEAFTGIYSDVTASYWNPAGLAKIDKKQIGFMYSEAVVDAKMGFMGIASPYAGGVCSLGGVFYTINSIPVTLQRNQILGEMSWVDGVLVFSYARKIQENISGGISGKLINRIVTDPVNGDCKGKGYAFDFGFIYETPVEGLNFGSSLLNTGTDIKMSGDDKKDPLPQTGRVGVAYEYPIDKDNTLIAATDMFKILDDDWHFGSGIELGHKNKVFFRTGYYQKEGNIQGQTYGLGLQLKDVQIDISNIPASEMIGYTRNSKVSIIVKF